MILKNSLKSFVQLDEIFQLMINELVEKMNIMIEVTISIDSYIFDELYSLYVFVCSKIKIY